MYACVRRFKGLNGNVMEIGEYAAITMTFYHAFFVKSLIEQIPQFHELSLGETQHATSLHLGNDRTQRKYHEVTGYCQGGEK